MSYLSLFKFFMLILVADNFVQMFVGWEGVGLCSIYFSVVINFWFSRIQANKYKLWLLI